MNGKGVGWNGMGIEWNGRAKIGVCVCVGGDSAEVEGKCVVM